MAEKIIILDFGSQYTQLIARRVRELNVYCEIHPFSKIPEFDNSVKGLILSGSPCSVRQDENPDINLGSLIGKVPILGICYGAQLIAHKSGGEVLPSEIREYGRANLAKVDSTNELLKEVNIGSQAWMSHGDTILNVPDNYEVIASTDSVRVAAFHSTTHPVWGIQFHPEVTHSEDGKILLRNFVVHICECSQDWTPDVFVDSTVSQLKDQLGDDQVVLGLSGGVDSSVAAMLIHKAIGKNLHCIFVDNGLLRKNEFEDVLESYKGMGLNVKGVNASKEFYDALKGLTDPEDKRKAIGRVFIEIFDKEAHAIQNVKWLGQGTIYPDVIECRTLEIDDSILGRHPFPGPGLGIRILGDITEEKVQILQEVDHVFIQGLKDEGLYDDVWQAGAMLLPVQSVGVMGDERT